MEQAAQPFNLALLTVPALFALAPVFLFYTGFQSSRREVSSFTTRSLYWLGGHGITLVAAALLTVFHGFGIPTMVATQLPLLFTVVYLALGLAFRSPYFLSLGLATPGLWMFVQKCWAAFSGETTPFYILPQEPFWYLLAAAVIFSLQYAPKPKQLWDDAQSWLVVISGSYLMGGFWLLSLGQHSLFNSIGLPQYCWAVVLFFLSGFLLWCAKYLRDSLFAACSVMGIAASVFSFISFFPWGS